MKVAHKIFFLCYTLLLRLWRWKRVIVFERTGGLGDVICCIPSYRALKQKYPKHLIIFATSKPLAALLRHCKEIDVVYGIPRGLTIPKQKAVWLVDRHYEPHTTDERGRGGRKLHLAHVFLDDCELPRSDWQPRFAVAEQRRANMINRFGVQSDEFLIAIHTGRTWPVRELPGDCWQQVINQIRDRLHCRILHFCSPTELEGKRFPAHELARVEKINPNMPLLDIATLFSLCRLFIGIDSGMLHLAGTLGIPSVGIFGPVNPLFRLPLGTPARGVSHILPCSYCHNEQPIKHWLTDCPHHIQCLKELPAGKIVSETINFIKDLHPEIKVG